MDKFKHISDESNVSADVMRFTCFLAPQDIPFELLISGAEEINPELSNILSRSSNTKDAILSVLAPLEREGLVTINIEKETYSTTPEIQQEIIEGDDT